MDNLLITGPKTTLLASKLSELKAICSRLHLQVNSTGRLGRAVKADYLKSILQRVSILFLLSFRILIAD